MDNEDVGKPVADYFGITGDAPQVMPISIDMNGQSYQPSHMHFAPALQHQDAHEESRAVTKAAAMKAIAISVSETPPEILELSKQIKEKLIYMGSIAATGKLTRGRVAVDRGVRS
ncbi:hypothetical protein Tco_1299660 [Tanacetum coccineum]